VEGSCKHGDEPSGSVKRWEVVECTTGGFLRGVQLRNVS
jgi:hypothetical protein